MFAPRPTLTTLLDCHVLPAKPTMRPGSVALLRGVIKLAETWAAQTVYADQLSREYLLAFRAWRIEQRRPPDCPRHAWPMVKSNALRARCPSQLCAESAVYVPPVSSATANRDIRHLRALWWEAIDLGFNTAPKKRIKPLPEELDNLPCFDAPEISAILAACQQENDLFLANPPAFWLALLLTVYDCGPRISVIMSTPPEHVDFGSGTIMLRARHQKQRKCQVVSLSEQTLEALKAIYDPAADYLFPWPYDRTQPGWRALTKRLKRILERASQPFGRKHLWHKFRRTTATWVTVELGIEAARELLGHSHVRVTDRYIDKTKLPKVKAQSRVLPRPDLPPAA